MTCAFVSIYIFCIKEGKAKYKNWVGKMAENVIEIYLYIAILSNHDYTFTF